MEIETLMILIPSLPLAAFLLLVVFGRFFGARSHWPVVLAFAGSFVLSATLLMRVQGDLASSQSGSQTQIGYEHVYTLWTWADVADAYTPRQPAESPTAPPPATATPHNFTIDITLRADPLTVFMLCMVTFISTLVALYASGYMHGDPGYPRFFTYI